MTTPIDWLDEVRVAEAVFRGIVTAGGCPAWVIDSTRAEVGFSALLKAAQLLEDPRTRGGQKAMKAALSEMHAHSRREAASYVRRTGTAPMPTEQAIGEYERLGREAVAAFNKQLNAEIAAERAARRAQEATV